MILRLSLACTISFAAGVALLDTAWGWAHRIKAEQQAEQVRTCSGYMVMALDGQTLKCRKLMPRFDPDWAIKPSPLRLRRAEIKRAIGGPK